MTVSSPEKGEKPVEKKQAAGKYTKTTLFVRKVPLDATDSDFSVYFSQFGPIRSSFLVKDKSSSSDSTAGHKGYGFVHFAEANDLESCLEAIKGKPFREGTKLKAEIALRKHVEYTPEIKNLSPKKGKSDKSKEHSEVKYLGRKVRVDFGSAEVPLKKQLYKKFRKFGQVTSISIDQEAHFVLVEFSSKDEATFATQKLNQHIFKGIKLAAQQIAAIKNDPSVKSFRLIVRNIPFGTTQTHLTDLFAPFGKVLEVTLPKKEGESSKIKGFAFVQMTNNEDATKAMEAINGKEFKNRVLAVDWSLSKNEYLKHAKSEEQVEECKVGEKCNEKAISGDNEDYLSIADGSNENEPEKKEAVKPCEESPAFSASSEIERTVFVRNLPFDTKDGDITELFSKFGEIEAVKLVKDKDTGFTRGSAFIIFKSDCSIKQCISKNNCERDQYAETSALVDADRQEAANGDHQKGLFLRGRPLYVFPAVDKKSAQKLSKSKLLQDGDLTVKDKRNLYLVNEGLIRAGAPAFRHWTADEVDFRKRLTKERQVGLKKDLNLMISSIRLSVRHLPTRVEESQLRNVVLKAIRDAKEYCKSGNSPPLFDNNTINLILGEKHPPRLTQVKIVRVSENDLLKEKEDLGNPKETNLRLNRSKGFGFVQFEKHIHAITCVRWLTNWADPMDAWEPAGLKLLSSDNDNKKRQPVIKWPIVEFATEKTTIVKAREERELAKKKRILCEVGDAEGGEKKKKKKKYFF